jgi:hypothetical protein
LRGNDRKTGGRHVEEGYGAKWMGAVRRPDDDDYCMMKRRKTHENWIFFELRNGNKQARWR